MPPRPSAAAAARLLLQGLVSSSSSIIQPSSSSMLLAHTGAAARQAVVAATGAAAQRPLLSCYSTAASAGGVNERTKMVNKLLYRARQRGFLELDLLVGLWAERELPRMDVPTLHQFAGVLDQENPDLFKWLTGQEEAPPELAANAAYQALRAHVAQQLADSCHVDTQAAAGKEWLRGWDDSWRAGLPAASDAAQQQQSRAEQAAA